MSHSVLLIEDEQEIREIIRAALEHEGFRVHESASGDSVIAVIESCKPNIVFVDQLLPGKHGTDIIKEIRGHQKHAKLPIIIVTGCDSEDEKVEGLSAGADDYVTKPFSRKELVARARAVLRRVEYRVDSPTNIIQNGSITIDLSAHRAMLDQTELPLTLTEFKILSELIHNLGKVLSRTDLCARVLGRSNVTDRTIDVHVAALRKKLGNRGDDIQTVRGVGYRFGGL